MLDVAAIRTDFPILAEHVRGGRQLVYLDSAATSQKPLQVLDAERNFYLHSNASVHRGAHALAERATDLYESARRTVAEFVGVADDQVVFVRNATEAINLVAYGFTSATALARSGNGPQSGRFVLQPDDELLVSEMEHHSNLVPWQEVAAKTGAVLRFIPLTDDGRLDLNNIDDLINPRTRMLSLVHQSNILGTVNPVAQLVAKAQAVGAVTLIDACQSIPHDVFSFSAVDADFVAFSGHKLLGPTGIGALLGKPEALEQLPAFLTGGSMIATVHLGESTWAPVPQKFEAGTPNAAQAVGLAAAIAYLQSIGMERIAAHERRLTGLALEGLRELPGVNIIGPTELVDRGGAISFTVDGIHPHDVGQVLDSHGIAVRVGHHCAWPVCRRYGVPATTRASFYLYNTEAEVEQLLAGIVATQKFFGMAP